MRHLSKNFWRLGLIAVVAFAASACVVDPGYGYGPGYYGAPATVYVAPGGYYGGGYGGYYHGGGHYHHGGYGHHGWR
ncbi:MAG: hypothetical protein JWR07_3991 [Nevskia sp.]|nr:hypothetical protein [Nevskia sp.]